MEQKTLRSLYAGAAVACVSGLLMGAAMKPTLNVGDRPEGPQMFAGWSGARSTGPFDDGATFAGYQGQVPDYVVGTDWKREIAWQEAEAADPEPRDVAANEAPPEHAPLRPAVFEEPAREAPVYPSMAGGMAYGTAAPAPPPPEAAATATFDADAPPEATGDTSLAKG